MAAVAVVSALLVARVRGPGPTGDGRPPLEEAVAGFRLLAREPAARVLVGLLGAQFVAIGALDVLYVVLAISVLELGGSGAGYLNAAFGAGGVAGIAVTVALVGRRHLLPPILLGVAVWGAAFALLAAWPTALGALLLLAAAGAGRSLLDVAGRTILQRTAPGDVLSRVFGVLEGLSMAEGEPGDRFYVVAEGELDVTAGGRELGRAGRGEGFGELALLRDVPRTATVTAGTDARLYALDKARFLASVASHPSAAVEAERLVHERLSVEHATIAP
jgi:Cyclic nucleotide-binding domain